MPITRSQLKRLRKFIKRQRQPRRKLRGGNKRKNPNPKPYLRPLSTPETQPLTRADMDAIEQFNADYGCGYAQARRVIMERKAQKAAQAP